MGLPESSTSPDIRKPREKVTTQRRTSLKHQSPEGSVRVLSACADAASFRFPLFSDGCLFSFGAIPSGTQELLRQWSSGSQVVPGMELGTPTSLQPFESLLDLSPCSLVTVAGWANTAG